MTGPESGGLGFWGLGLGLGAVPSCSQAATEPFLHAQSTVLAHPGPGPGPTD